MSLIVENITLLKQQIPPSVKLVAVSKTKPVGDIIEAYSIGQRCFGENRVQELLKKKDNLPKDIKWHLIGHLQSNKVNLVVPFIKMIQSVDSFKLLKIINSEAAKIKREIKCLLQIHIATEESKFGFSINELDQMLGSPDFKSMDYVRICGVMGMATLTNDKDQIRNEFRYLRECFYILKRKYFSGNPDFKEISMGMSGDFDTAIKEGSTLIRIGSLIFGDRK